MSWKEPKVGKPLGPGLEGSLWSHQDDRKPDLKELLLYRTMSGLTVGPRLDPQVTSSEGPRPPSAIHSHQAPHHYRCDTSSFGPTSSGGPNLVASKFSDNLYCGPREVAEAPRKELRDQKPPLNLLSESQLMPPPMGPPPPGGPGPRSEAPKVSSTTPHRDHKESIGKNGE